MRTIGFWISVVLLLFMGLSGLQGFFSDFPLVENLGQRFVNLAQLTFGLTGLGAAIGGILKKHWTGRVASVFPFGAGVAAGLAPVYWGESGPLTGIASGLLGFLIGYLLYMGVRRVGHPEEGVGSASPPPDEVNPVG